MHGNAHLVGDVLKQRLGFDGLVVSDWNGIEQVPGCTKWHCPQAINAGIDLVMVPDDWKAVHRRHDRGRPRRRDPDEPHRRCRVPDHPREAEAGLFDASPATGPHPTRNADSAARATCRARRCASRWCC
jgi:beta-glucosidase